MISFHFSRVNQSRQHIAYNLTLTKTRMKDKIMVLRYCPWLYLNVHIDSDRWRVSGLEVHASHAIGGQPDWP